MAGVGDLLNIRLTSYKSAIFCLILTSLFTRSISQALDAGDETGMSKCYDSFGDAQRCVPPFMNAAFELPVVAGNTCGQRQNPTKYCLQTGVTGVTKSCHLCNSTHPTASHPSKYLTDFHDEDAITWWQSETMLEEVQFPNSVNLTLNLGKSFDITFVRLKFHTSRPESFAIYKRTTSDSDWTPYQYYSGDCLTMYNLPLKEYITYEMEDKAICTDEYSNISPLTGGNVAFSTLQGRPSRTAFDQSPVLQEWVTATDIRITLNRLNTFGDEVFNAPNVLRSYYYAISDFSVGARCKCNGHANQCKMSTAENGDERMVCVCSHNTAGADCEQCKPFYNNKPWGPATAADAHECEICDCNGFSNRCMFNQDLYDRTGYGGFCVDCTQNTAGPKCDRCRENYYRSSLSEPCRLCDCNLVGSLNLQCSSNGQCVCKPGVGGLRCDQCLPNYYDFGITGCRACNCYGDGSLGNQEDCNSNSGDCSCKQNVEGRNCDRCKPGFFNLQGSDEFGCLACFCHGHSSDCTSIPGYENSKIESRFTLDRAGWTGVDRGGNEQPINFNSIRGNIGLYADTNNFYYFQAPFEFLGDQIFSYGQYLTFDLRVDQDDVRLSSEDLVIEGAGYRVTAPMRTEDYAEPSQRSTTFSFRLHESPSYGWTSTLDTFRFQRMMSNLTSIRIRATYGTQDNSGTLDNVKLDTVRRSVLTTRDAANQVEVCTCPQGYVGQSCESCTVGYFRDPPYGDPFARCVPCECNNHATVCSPDSGICRCEDNTEGDNCQRCSKGYYGVATRGNREDCLPCPCPDQSECMQDSLGEVICIRCPEGYIGNRCDVCADGYYGDPAGHNGPASRCNRCTCGGNIDSNAVGNCDSTTGECLKCIYNTAGFFCEYCADGYYGDAMADPKGQCQPCECNVHGSGYLTCDRNGVCHCQENVLGDKCDECYDGYFNIASGNGCEACGCSPTGSTRYSCDQISGQCDCRQGVDGRQCQSCLYDHYSFSTAGCDACSCDPLGSLYLNCTEQGSCTCREGVLGVKCDSCEINKYDISQGCIDCPECYNLVADKVKEHEEAMETLRKLISTVDPTEVNDKEFERRLKELDEEVKKVLADARQLEAPVDISGIEEAIAQLREQLERIEGNKNQADEDTNSAQGAISQTIGILNRAQATLNAAKDYLKTEGDKEIEKLRQANENSTAQQREMKELTFRATAAADRLENSADAIAITADEALKTSNDALDVVNGIEDLDYIEPKVNDLETRYTDVESLADEAERVASEALMSAQDAHDESTNLLNEAQKPLPSFDTDAMSKNATDIITEAKRIQDEANALINDNQMLLTDVEEKSKEGRGLLDEKRRLQQETDRLLATVDSHKADAEQAKKDADKALEDAEQTRDTLKVFDDQVEASKKDAEVALRELPDIEQTISEANNTANDAKAAVDAAKEDAINARKIADEALDIATMASEEAKKIKDEANQTFYEALDLQGTAVRLEGEVQEVKDQLKALEDQADSDEQLAAEALAKANSAEATTKMAKSSLEDAQELLAALLENIGQLGDLDFRRLEELEQELIGLNRTLLLDLQLDTKINTLEARNVEQKKWLNEYEIDITQLEADVRNIEDIRDSLPSNCYNKVRIEVEPIP
ncbi:laminin subunit gamma-1-like [Antedon mediterranea]|uniref:laminin subunit gamma-1-like n=1 Tax=Antedon mediterranea TaxID=105859 RepID=UPI003AF6EC83